MENTKTSLAVPFIVLPKKIKKKNNLSLGNFNWHLFNRYINCITLLQSTKRKKKNLTLEFI